MESLWEVRIESAWCLLAEARSAALAAVSVLAMVGSVSLVKCPSGSLRSLRRPWFSVACRASVASDRRHRVHHPAVILGAVPASDFV